MRSAGKRRLCNKPASLPGMKSLTLTGNWITSTSIWNRRTDNLLLTKKRIKTFIPFKFDMKKRRIALKLSLHYDTPLFSVAHIFRLLYTSVFPFYFYYKTFMLPESRYCNKRDYTREHCQKIVIRLSKNCYLSHLTTKKQPNRTNYNVFTPILYYPV